jgi:lysophospholipase L1-like esterase
MENPATIRGVPPMRSVPHSWLLTVLLLAAAGAFPHPAGAAPPAKPAVEKKEPKKDEGLLGLFKFHYANRVKGFKEQNLLFRNVVLVGDSITEGFEVERYFPGRRVLNRGIGGDVIGNGLPADDPRGVLRRLDDSVYDCAATDVFLMIGINDLNSGRTVAGMEEGYRDLLKQIKARVPGVKVHVQSLLPTRAGSAKQNEPVRQFNARLRKLAAEFGYDYVDLHTLFKDEQGELKAEFTADGLHLTDPGYQVWRREVARRLGWESDR